MTITYAVGQRITASLLQTLADYGPNKPHTKLVQQTSQNFTDNTATAVAFGTSSEIVDTAGLHDETTNNTRITPNVAGWYELKAIFHVPAATDYASTEVYIRLNGTTNLPSANRDGPNATSSRRAIETVISASANGTTDYFEVLATQDNTTSATRAVASDGSYFSCTFECTFIRPL